MKSDLSILADGELVLLSIARCDVAFAEIVERHRAALYRIALASLGNADDALDVVQDTFVAAHAALRRFDTTRPLRPWLARIALNRCRDRIRRRMVRRVFFGTNAGSEGREDPVEAMADDRPDQGATLAGRQELARTLRAISMLPAAIREPIVLRTIEGLSQAETAQTLGISGKAVETRLRRARIALKTALDLH